MVNQVICQHLARCSLPFGHQICHQCANAPMCHQDTSLHSILLCKLVISIYPSQDPLVDAYLTLRPHSPLSEISTAALILHIQHPFCQSHSVKGPQSAHTLGSLVFSSLQLATGTSCNKHYTIYYLNLFIQRLNHGNIY